MSAILKQTQKLYKNVIKIELLIAILIFFLTSWHDKSKGMALGLGLLSGILPQMVLIFFVYFRANAAQNMRNPTALYQGEGLKFLLSIVLIATLFALYSTLNYLSFFSGFILALVMNNSLPIYFRLNAKKQRS